MNLSENVPGNFTGVIHQQKNNASKLGGKQAPHDPFLPNSNLSLCILFAVYHGYTYVIPSNQLQKKRCGSFVASEAMHYLFLGCK